MEIEEVKNDFYLKCSIAGINDAILKASTMEEAKKSAFQKVKKKLLKKMEKNLELISILKNPSEYLWQKLNTSCVVASLIFKFKKISYTIDIVVDKSTNEYFLYASVAGINNKKLKGISNLEGAEMVSVELIIKKLEKMYEEQDKLYKELTV